MKTIDVRGMTDRGLSIALAACKKKYETAEDDYPLHRALRSLGVTVSLPVWNQENHDWRQYNLVVPRTTWDYQQHFPDFCRWLEGLENTTLLCNPIATLLWDAHKKYLKDVEAAGVRVMPTVFVGGNGDVGAQVRQAIAKHGRGRVLIKPAVGASSSDCMVFDASDAAAAVSHAQKLLSGAQDMVLVQPFSSSVVVLGEYSLMLWDGKPSHGVHKTSSSSSEFRVQEEHGGTNEAWPEPPKEVVEMAIRACECAPGGWHYARCDFLNDEELGWCLIELEMLEPSFYLEFAEEQEVKRLASMLQRLAKGV